MTGRSRLVSGNAVRALFLHQRCSEFHADSASALRREFLPHVKLWCLGACVKFGFARREFPTGSTGPQDEASMAVVGLRVRDAFPCFCRARSVHRFIES